MIFISVEGVEILRNLSIFGEEKKWVILRSILLMVISTVEFSIMQSMIRYVSGSIHPFELAFFRILFGVVALIPIGMKMKLPMLNRSKLGLYASRAALSSVAMSLTFLGLSMLPLAEATALSFSSPLFSSVIAVFILKETAHFQQWMALAFGFMGTLVIIRPGLEIIDPGAVVILISSMVVAWVVIFIKVLSRTESSLSITFYTGIMQIPIVFLFAIPFWTWPRPDQWIWLLAIGGLGSLGQICMTQAYKRADVTTILPFNFCKLIWASLIGFFIFAEIPDLWTWVGGAMIFMSGAFIAYREASQKKIVSVITSSAGDIPPVPEPVSSGRS